MIGRLCIIPFGSIWKLKQLYQNTHNSIVKKFCSVLYNLYQYENGGSIAWNARFHGEPYLPHGMKGIFINGGAEIGKNCVIYHQVTIGGNMLLGSKGIGSPKIGDNCFIGAGAKIIGNVRIGNNVRVGANAVVYKDVPDNSIVVSGEQRTIPRDAPLDNRCYSWHGHWVYFESGNWHPVTDPVTLAALEASARNARSPQSRVA